MKNFAIIMLSVAFLAVPAIQSQFEEAAAQDAAKTNDSGTMARADADMRDVLVALGELRPKPLVELSVTEARKQPGPAEAIESLLRSRGMDPSGTKLESGVSTTDVTYPGAGGNIPARIYKADGLTGAAPVILYIHGGGWVLADLDTYDATPRALAKKTKAIVVSVHYRQAPEHKFPAAHDDVAAAYQWLLKSAASWGGDARRVAIVGESAGGNMAIATAMVARDKGWNAPLHVVAIYPVAGTSLDTPSYAANENARPLDKATMRWFFEQAIGSASDLSDPRLNLVKAADLKELPPVTIITADIDPLKSDGFLLAERIKSAGGQANLRNFDGVTHEFFGMDAVVRKAGEAQDFAVQQLRRDLIIPSSN